MVKILFDKIPAVILVVLSIISINVGAGYAKILFTELTPQAVVFLRVGFAAVLLLIFTRVRFWQFSREQWWALLAFSAALALMNFTYYLSLQRLPLGLAVTIEFLGPLAVALWHSRRAMDLLWVALAATGIALLNPFSGDIDTLGVVYALIAGACWGAYIILGERLGSRFAGTQGITASMCIATVMLMPWGLVDSLPAFTNSQLLLAALGVAFLSSAIPYTLEIEALRRIETRLFGILMSLEPAVAALMGFIIIGEALSLLQMVAIVAVSMASYGAVRFARTKNET